MIVAHRLPNQRPLTRTGFARGFFGFAFRMTVLGKGGGK